VLAAPAVRAGAGAQRAREPGAVGRAGAARGARGWRRRAVERWRARRVRHGRRGAGRRAGVVGRAQGALPLRVAPAAASMGAAGGRGRRGRLRLAQVVLLVRGAAGETNDRPGLAAPSASMHGAAGESGAPRPRFRLSGCPGWPSASPAALAEVWPLEALLVQRIMQARATGWPPCGLSVCRPWRSGCASWHRSWGSTCSAAAAAPAAPRTATTGTLWTAACGSPMPPAPAASPPQSAHGTRRPRSRRTRGARARASAAKEQRRGPEARCPPPVLLLARPSTGPQPAAAHGGDLVPATCSHLRV
jgi:hypothetical protein